MASTNASLEFEMSRLRHQLDKSRKENEDLKEKLFQVCETNFKSYYRNFEFYCEEFKHGMGFVILQKLKVLNVVFSLNAFDCTYFKVNKTNFH